MAGTILTNIGLSKLASATPQNQLNITHIAVGDGNGGFPTLSPTMTSLTNEVWRGDSSNPVKDSANTNYVYFETNIPPEVGPFDVREIACFDSDGDMIAIGHTSLIQKPDPVDDANFAVATKIFIALENASDFDLIYQNTEVTSHNTLADRNAIGAHDDIYSRNLNCIKDLENLTGFAQEGQQVSITGFYDGSNIGGGAFTWDAARDKADHNGGTVIAPEAAAEWDGTQPDLATLFDWTGTGAGCWVRSGKIVSPYYFGAIADGETPDTLAIAAAYATGKSVTWDGDASYVLDASDAVQFKTGQHTFGHGATALVPDGCTVSDVSGDGFGRFDNHALKIDTGPAAWDKRTLVDGLNFVVGAEKINAMGGRHTLTRSANTGSIQIQNVTLQGKGTASGLGGHDAVSYTTLGAFCYFSGVSVTADNITSEDTGLGVMIYGANVAELLNSDISFCGVSRDFTSWQNQSALDIKGNVVRVKGNTFTCSGGSSVFIRRTQGAEADNGIKEVYFEDNVGIGCGLSFAGIGTRFFSDVANIDIVSCKNNKVFGWLCGIGGIQHSGMLISLEDDFSSEIKEVVTGGNVVNYLAPWETYNESTNEIDGSYNGFKSANQDHGNQYGVRVNAGDNGTILNHVNSSADIVQNHDTLGVSVSGVLHSVCSLKCINVGWQRDASGDAYQIQQSIRLVDTAGSFNLEIVKHGQGVNASNPFTTPVLLENIDGTIELKVSKSGSAVSGGRTVRYVQNVQGNVLRIDSLATDCQLVDAGNVYIFDTSAGTYTKNSSLEWKAGTVYNQLTGSRTIDVSAGVLSQKYDSFAPLSPTLPPVESFKGRAIIINTPNNTMTLNPTGADNINGVNGPVTVTNAESASIYSDGAEWSFTKR